HNPHSCRYRPRAGTQARDATVGKSSLLRRYPEGISVEGVTQTVLADFSMHFVEGEPGVQVKIQFWVTAGQERFQAVTCSYYQNLAGGLLLFDTNRTSFESITQWHQEVLEKVKPFNIFFLVLGHKTEGENPAASLGACYVETSAKSNSDISTAFELLTPAIYEAVKRWVMGPNSEGEGVKAGSYCRPSLRRQRTKARPGGCSRAGEPWMEQPRPLEPMEPSQSTRAMLGTGQDDAKCH
uniref:RAB42, member RAS oncogene family n=1 Tax=Equus asinus TaxID=9793 RepID=A0A9L0KB99_EQUAS